jgi:D-aminopeptidase
MICHRFKGGIGTSSRRLDAAQGGFTVGALVQANYGVRERLAVDGVPVGREIGLDEVPADREDGWLTAAGATDAASATAAASTTATRSAPQVVSTTAADAGAGSIIVVLATDAPLLPHQCERLAQRAGLGVARSGGAGEHSSGDLFIAFATGNRGLAVEDRAVGRPFTHEVRALDDAWMSPLFWAAIEATEGAILNALVAAETMAGRDGHVAYRLPHERLVEVWRRHRG